MGAAGDVASQPFGSLLRRHRIAAGLTQEELAERAGLSARGLSDLERGVRRLAYRNTVQRLADALGLAQVEREALSSASRRVGRTTRGGHVLESHLPTTLTTFVGRAEELAEVRRLLESSRLLTLTGAGGMGKTRRAIELVRGLAQAHTGGVVFVELAALAEPALVPQAVASALGIQEQPGRPLRQTLVDALRSRQVLLVLDNCEHLVQVCAEIAESLLRDCPDLRILATSRQPLRIPGEVAWRVPPLGMPLRPGRIAPGELASSEAALLFVERARAAQPGFGLSEQNAPHIAQICHRLDGIPLALELAAARVPALGVPQLATRLEDCFSLLTGGSRTALPRQRTLRGALDWSCGLLSDREQRLFQRLSVFAGGWTLEAAEAICAGEVLPRAEVLGLLAELVDQSLVVAEECGGSQRCRLLEPVRQYARERLEAADEGDELGRLHAEYFTRLAEAAEPELLGPAQAEWLDRLEVEHDNLRAALARATRRGPGRLDGVPMAALGLRLATALVMLWHIRGYWHEGRRWLEAALVMAARAPALLRAKALNAAGWLAWDQGDYDRAGALSEEALALSRVLGDPWSIGWSTGRLSHVRWMQGRYDEAAALAEEAVSLFRGLDAPWYLGWSLHQSGRVAHARGDEERASDLFEESLAHFGIAGDRGFGMAFQFANLGDVARACGDLPRAIQLYEEVLARLRALGFKQGLVHTLHSLAAVCRARGDDARARALHLEALLLCRDLGDLCGIATSLEGLAEIARVEGRLEFAGRLFAAASRLRESVGCPLPPAEMPTHERSLAALRSGLGSRTFRVTWDFGRAMASDEAIAYALEDATGA